MSAEVETTLKRIQSHRGVQGIVIANHHGSVLKTTMTEEMGNKYGSLLSILAVKAKSVVRQIEERSELTFLSLKTTENEIMVSVDLNNKYLLIVVQDAKTENPEA